MLLLKSDLIYNSLKISHYSSGPNYLTYLHPMTNSFICNHCIQAAQTKQYNYKQELSFIPTSSLHLCIVCFVTLSEKRKCYHSMPVKFAQIQGR